MRYGRRLLFIDCLPLFSKLYLMRQEGRNKAPNSIDFEFLIVGWLSGERAIWNERAGGKGNRERGREGDKTREQSARYTVTKCILCKKKKKKKIGSFPDKCRRRMSTKVTPFDLQSLSKPRNVPNKGSIHPGRSLRKWQALKPFFYMKYGKCVINQNLKFQRSEIRDFLRRTIAMKPGKAINLNDKSWPDPQPPVETKRVAIFSGGNHRLIWRSGLKQFYLFYDIAFLRL